LNRCKYIIYFNLLAFLTWIIVKKHLSTTDKPAVNHLNDLSLSFFKLSDTFPGMPFSGPPFLSGI
ncbi:MAG: hypothetical protein LUF04_13620, partial [Bacteroides sp.]|nr:hypothetical protein [Bacteroides sp.]